MEQINPNQKIEQNAYQPKYKVLPSFRMAVMECVGDRPFNEIAAFMNAVSVEEMDHTTLTNIIHVLGQFPFIRVEKLMRTLNDHIQQIIED